MTASSPEMTKTIGAMIRDRQDNRAPRFGMARTTRAHDRDGDDNRGAMIGNPAEKPT
jgi:hypothetical protein